jgi:hypothetical protein
MTNIILVLCTFMVLASCSSPKETTQAEMPSKDNEDYPKLVKVCFGVEECDDKGGIQKAEDLPIIDTSWFDLRKIYGAMTSCYNWDSIGSFPLAGQYILEIGSPTFESAKLKTENPFKVRTVNNSDNNIFVQTAKLNGKPLDRAFIYFKEFAAGAELVLEMGNKPSKWGTQELPPSYGPENN